LIPESTTNGIFGGAGVEPRFLWVLVRDGSGLFQISWRGSAWERQKPDFIGRARELIRRSLKIDAVVDDLIDGLRTAGL
jgi:hypothetical protein